MVIMAYGNYHLYNGNKHLNVMAIYGVLLFVCTLQTGFALRCWSCSSDLDITCMDFFNVTKIQQQRSYYQSSNYNQQVQRNDQPNLVECSHNLGQLYNNKQVCMKRKMTVPGGRQITMRECKFVSGQQQVGTCPDEPTGRGTSIDFCEYCETDGCNGAHAVRFHSLIPAIVLLPWLVYFYCRL